MFITVGQVRSHSVILYDQYQLSHYGKSNTYPKTAKELELSKKRSENLKSIRQQRYSGKMTEGARKRLRKAIDLLCQSVQPKWVWNSITGQPHLHKLSFITLTISSKNQLLTADQAYKRLLRDFLQWGSKYKGMKTYIWKAELQQRGQIHYHITTPAFIPYDQIRDKWNQLQKREGLLNDYYEEKGNYDPNSTDVHEVYKIKDVAAYLMKYLTKEIDIATQKQAELQENDQSDQKPEKDKKTTTTGKIWDCSLNLKKAKYYTFEESNTTRDHIKKLEKEEKVILVNADRCTIIKCINCKPTELLSKHEQDIYRLHMRAINAGYCDSRELAPENTNVLPPIINQPSSSGKPAIKQGQLFVSD